MTGRGGRKNQDALIMRAWDNAMYVCIVVGSIGGWLLAGAIATILLALVCGGAVALSMKILGDWMILVMAIPTCMGFLFGITFIWSYINGQWDNLGY